MNFVPRNTIILYYYNYTYITFNKHFLPILKNTNIRSLKKNSYGTILISITAKLYICRRKYFILAYFIFKNFTPNIVLKNQLQGRCSVDHGLKYFDKNSI